MYIYERTFRKLVLQAIVKDVSLHTFCSCLTHGRQQNPMHKQSIKS